MPGLPEVETTPVGELPRILANAPSLALGNHAEELL